MANISSKKSNGNGDGNRKIKTKLRSATERFEETINRKGSGRAVYILRLYVTGSSPRSLRAISNLKSFCEQHLPDDYDLEIIDIYKNPEALRDAQIVAAPTLIKKLPAPLRRFVGDLSNKQKLLVGMGIYK
jgi:circadian clock protein KaiB